MDSHGHDTERLGDFAISFGQDLLEGEPGRWLFGHDSYCV